MTKIQGMCGAALLLLFLFCVWLFWSSGPHCSVDNKINYGTLQSWERLNGGYRYDSKDTTISTDKIELVVQGYPALRKGMAVTGGTIASRWCPTYGLNYVCFDHRCVVKY